MKYLFLFSALSLTGCNSEEIHHFVDQKCEVASWSKAQKDACADGAHIMAKSLQAAQSNIDSENAFLCKQTATSFTKSGMDYCAAKYGFDQSMYLACAHGVNSIHEVVDYFLKRNRRDHCFNCY